MESYTTQSDPMNPDEILCHLLMKTYKNSLLHLIVTHRKIPLCMVVQLPWWHITSSLKEHHSFEPDRSCLQRVRACAPFPISLSMFPSLEREPRCLASLPSNSWLLIPLFQRWRKQVTMLIWTMAEIFLRISQLTQGQGLWLLDFL